MINNKKKMQTHIEKAYQFLDDHLPHNYADKTFGILKKAKISSSLHIIRNVRNNKSNNIDVLNGLLKVAKKNKIAKEAIVLQTEN
jgi:hypothetical protein